MAGLVPYLHFDGTARAALEFYHDVFGGELTVHTFADFGRTEEPLEAIAHGILEGPVALFAADAVDGDTPLRVEGMMFSLLGTAPPEILHRWFDALADGGTVRAPLEQRAWGAHDGQVVDRFGLSWLIGYET